MLWCPGLSFRASLFCGVPVIVRWDQKLPDGFIGMVRPAKFVPIYIIRLNDIRDSATFWHEVWHVRLMDWSMHKEKKAALLRLRQTCRKVADSDPILATLLGDVYDQTIGIDTFDEPVVRCMERPDLHERLPRDDRHLLFRLQRASWLDLKTYWFHWVVIVAIVHWLVISI